LTILFLGEFYIWILLVELFSMTGIERRTLVSPGSCLRNLIYPFRASENILLLDRPNPMPLSFTFLSNPWFNSSPYGLKRWVILS